MALGEECCFYLGIVTRILDESRKDSDSFIGLPMRPGLFSKS